MIPVRFNHTIPFNHVHTLFESLMGDDIFGPMAKNKPENEKLFAADIYDKDGAYVIKADMPGMEKKT